MNNEPNSQPMGPLNEKRYAYDDGFEQAKHKDTHCPYEVGSDLRASWLLGRVHGHDYLVTVGGEEEKQITISEACKITMEILEKAEEERIKMLDGIKIVNNEEKKDVKDFHFFAQFFGPILFCNILQL